MRRLVIVIAVALVALGIAAPVALAAGPVAEGGRVLVSVNGPLDLPSGAKADVVVVANGDATIEGEVNALLVVNGNARLSGAHAGSIAVVHGDAQLLAGTVVDGDVRTIDGQVEQAAGTTVSGRVGGLEADIAALGVVLLPAFVLLFIGLALVTIVAALAVAALAARQTRDAELLISRQPLQTLVAAIVGAILLPIIAILAIVTVVGAPIGLAFLVFVLPAMAYLGWIVAAIWIGDWILIRTRGSAEPERPYRAAVVGVVVLGVASLLPPISAIASLFGFGAVLLLGWRVFRREPLLPPAARQVSAPTLA